MFCFVLGGTALILFGCYVLLFWLEFVVFVALVPFTLEGVVVLGWWFV